MMDDGAWKSNLMPASTYHVSVLKLIIDPKGMMKPAPRSRFARVALQPTNYVPFLGVLCKCLDRKGASCCDKKGIIVPVERLYEWILHQGQTKKSKIVSHLKMQRANDVSMDNQYLWS